MEKENYIKSLEVFMVKVSKKVNCLPDFFDPANGNDHIFRAIDKLLSQNKKEETDK